MTNQAWLTLNEYSAKHKISQSTLRRRIRDGRLEHRFEGGKYHLLDQTIQRQAIVPEIEPSLLMNEIKSAYKSILQEKETQILQLKEEIVDLKTLVRILETREPLFD